MPAQRLSMRHVKEVLRLKWGCGLSERKSAHSCGISRPTVADSVRRAQAAGLSWPLPEALEETTLDRLLFPARPGRPSPPPLGPDWSVVHQELQRQGVTLLLLWEEYKATTPDGSQYSGFCRASHAWTGQLDLVMRQHHRAGETLFVDYAGQGIPVVNSHTGEVREAALFIAVLGASNYTYAEAPWSQTLPDWMGSHVRAFAALGGVPAVVVPDTLKAAVSRAHRSEPELNRTSAALARHSGVAVVPARAAKPRDQAQVAVGGHIVARWILARLRHHTFFALTEVHAPLTTLLVHLNRRPFKKLPGSRQSVFASLEGPALRPLPGHPYEDAEWQQARVNSDYHVEAAGHYYSVPYALVTQQLDVRLSAPVVELFHKGTRVASPLRSSQKGRHSTVADHMPPAHRHDAAWPPQRLVRWAAHSGPAVAQVVETMLTSRPHPQQGFRACLGRMRLGKRYGAERLATACQRALTLGACSSKSIASLLKHNLDRPPVPAKPAGTPPPGHGTIRGPQDDAEEPGDRSCSRILRGTHCRPADSMAGIPRSTSRCSCPTWSRAALRNAWGCWWTAR
jgi:transposase